MRMYALQSFKNEIKNKEPCVVDQRDTWQRQNVSFLVFILHRFRFAACHRTLKSKQHAYAVVSHSCLLFESMRLMVVRGIMSDSANVCFVCTRWRTRRNAKHKTFITNSSRNVMILFSTKDSHYHRRRRRRYFFSIFY